MELIEQYTDGFVVGLITNFVSSLLGVIVAIYFWDRYVNNWLYGGSTVSVKRAGEIVLPGRKIGWRKAKEIAEDDSELSVFLKGVASPYTWINCDIVFDGRELGMLTSTRYTQKWFGERYDYVIDLDKNPPKEPGRYDNWRFRVIQNGETAVSYTMNPASAQEMLEWVAVTPFGPVDYALVSDGMEMNYFSVEEAGRLFTLDWDKKEGQNGR